MLMSRGWCLCKLVALLLLLLTSIMAFYAIRISKLGQICQICVLFACTLTIQVHLVIIFVVSNRKKPRRKVYRVMPRVRVQSSTNLSPKPSILPPNSPPSSVRTLYNILSFLLIAPQTTASKVSDLSGFVHPISYKGSHNLLGNLKTVTDKYGLISSQCWTFIFNLIMVIIGLFLSLSIFLQLIRILCKPQEPLINSKQEESNTTKPSTLSCSNIPLAASSYPISMGSLQDSSDNLSSKQIIELKDLVKRKLSKADSLKSKLALQDQLFRIPEVSQNEELNSNYAKSLKNNYGPTFEPIKHSFKKCRLCNKSLSSKGKLLRMKQCFHLFHVECLVEWDKRFLPLSEHCPICTLKRKS